MTQRNSSHGRGFHLNPGLAQLKHDIDSGATADKVPVTDPPSAPLGTDAKAAGAPPLPELIAAVRRLERTNPNPPEHAHDRGGRRLGLRLLGSLLLTVALAALAFCLARP